MDVDTTSARSDYSPDTPTAEDGAVTSWSERVDSVLDGDLVAVLGIVTSTGGVLLHPVAPVGLRHRDEGSVVFTSSLGYWKKLQRIERNPQVGLLFSDRSHGHATDPITVLVQGEATVESQPDETFLDELFDHHMPRFFGPTRHGRIWDRLTREYYRIRVRVTIAVRRLLAWEPTSGDVVEAVGERWPATQPGGQTPPAKGTAPFVPVAKAARRANRLRTTCLGYVGGDGYPVMVPVTVRDTSDAGLELTSVRLLPQGGRRAGVFSQSYGPGLKGASIQYHSGWLDVIEDEAWFAPHTSRGFTAPFGIRTATLAGSLQAKHGLKQACRQGVVAGDRWIGKPSDDRNPHRPSGKENQP